MRYVNLSSLFDLTSASMCNMRFVELSPHFDIWFLMASPDWEDNSYYLRELGILGCSAIGLHSERCVIEFCYVQMFKRRVMSLIMTLLTSISTKSGGLLFHSACLPWWDNSPVLICWYRLSLRSISDCHEENCSTLTRADSQKESSADMTPASAAAEKELSYRPMPAEGKTYSGIIHWLRLFVCLYWCHDFFVCCFCITMRWTCDFVALCAME